MNFKPTALKIVSSVIIAIIVFILMPRPLCKLGGECNLTFWPVLISLVLTYIIWSLFEKKKEVRGKKK